MSEVNVKVRVGTPDDVDGMMQLSLAACEENGLSNPNPTKLLSELWPALNLDHGIVGIIGKPGEKFEAAILLRTDAMWYTDTTMLIERAIFVDPEFRRGSVGRARLLIDFAKEAAESLDMPLIIGILSSHRAEAKVKLYKRQFGEPSGAYWIFGAKTGSWKEPSAV